MDLRDLSVVLPTYRRPEYALRNMHLLDPTGARVHVLDGSPMPLDSDRLGDLSSRVNYLHVPESYERRLAKATDLIDTPYCVMVGDDDIHLPSGLAASMAALDADPELVATTGTALAVLVEDGAVKGRLVYDALHGRAISADDPVQRMVEHLADYLPSTVYAVTRTSVWVKAMRTAIGKRFSPIRLSELQYEMAVAYQGRTQVIPHLMWLRSSENRPHWKSDDVPLLPWWDQAASSGERHEFGAYMGSVLTDDPGEQSIAAQGSLKAMDAYVEALKGRAELHRSLTPAQRRERWPAHPVLPLAEWGRRIAESGVVVNEAELAVAGSAIAATPVVAEDAPASSTSG